jgi:CRISPR-associated protein (TIGR02710 family)
MKTLFITVGGSPQPVKTAITSLQPDRVVFVCSDGDKGSKSQIIGSGKPCREYDKNGEAQNLPNIPTQLNLGDKFNPEDDVVLLENLDNLSEVYGKIAQKVRDVRAQDDKGQILADYTGGTKTMSAALVQVAIEEKLDLYVTSSTQRKNLVRVERGERVRRATTASLMVERTVTRVLPLFLSQYNYPAAISELETILQERELSNENSKRVQFWLDCCTGFDLWDRFDHAEAWFYLEPLMSFSRWRDLTFFLKRVMKSRQDLAPASNDNFIAPESMKGHGYEIVQDLLLNAERRAKLSRYDDAVSRLYRALELLEQVRLWEAYKIKTSDVDLQKIPDSLREKYKKSDKKIELPLLRSYELLSEFSNDPIGHKFKKHQNKIKNALQIRNFSILAHGLRPITSQDYQEFKDSCDSFIKESISLATSSSSLACPQFPQDFSV